MFDLPARRLGVALFISTGLHALTLLALAPSVPRKDGLVPALGRHLSIQVVSLQTKSDNPPPQPATPAIEASVEQVSPTKTQAPAQEDISPPEASGDKNGISFDPLVVPLPDPSRCGGTIPVHSYEETESRPYVLRDMALPSFFDGDNLPHGRIVMQLCIAENGLVWNVILLDSELPAELSEEIRKGYLSALFSPGRIAQKPVRTAIVLVGMLTKDGAIMDGRRP